MNWSIKKADAKELILPELRCWKKYQGVWTAEIKPG